MTEQNGVERSNATDELRRMLDERGVEYFKHEDGEPLRKLEKADEPATSWHMGGASVCAVPIEDSGLFDLWIDHCTPEQAIEATLDSSNCTNSERTGTCHDKNGFDPFFGFECVECGATVDAYMCSEYAGVQEQFRYCPGCGARVVTL